jgi:hypothetical protein
LFRRFRSLLFATLGLALYPRDVITGTTPHEAGPTPHTARHREAEEPNR